MKKKNKSKLVLANKSNPFERLSPPFIILLLIIFFLVGISWYRFYSNKTVIENKPFLTTYEQCAQLEDSKIINTYPKQCESRDGTEFFEIVKEPIDTSNWELFTNIEGFTVKCPPGWFCLLNELNNSSMNISSEVPGIANINLFFITPNNFQDSLIRHPNYSNPIDWLNDVKAKNNTAITMFDSTIIPVEGTDQQLAPKYYQANFDTISIVTAKNGEGVVIPIEFGDTSVVIPVTNSEVILSISQPDTFYKNPIWKAIIESISIQ